MLAATPPMGWNSWNTFGRNIDADLIVETAEAIVAEGLRDVGYEYVVVDDVWEAEFRVDGKLTWNPDRFPQGIRPIADHVHGLGLKFGIYSCAGSFTCEGLPGSYGHEAVDALTFADWGVDFLKYDFCHVPPGAHGPTLYRRMGQALRSTGRDIVFSVCEWGSDTPWEWAAGTGAHLWRTTGDITDSWASIRSIGFDQQRGLEAYAGPDRWNDPDMLVVGMYGKGNVGAGGCSDAEYESHFSLWSLLAAPLMIGCDVRSLTAETKRILGNPAVIALNQDPLGRQGRQVGASYHANERADVWAKPLADGSVAVGLFNLGESDGRLIVASWDVLGIDPQQPCRVVDLWSGEEIGVRTVDVSRAVDAHGVSLLRVTPV